MTIDQARALARARQAREKAAEGVRYATWRSPIRYEPVKRSISARPEPTSGLVCPHFHLVWQPCQRCNRTEENALAQTLALRAMLGM